MKDHFFTVAELIAKEGKLDELKQVLDELANETRKEKGALEYFFIEDELKPNTILSIERWDGRAAEAEHWQTTHLTQALAKLGGILEGDAIIHKGLQII